MNPPAPRGSGAVRFARYAYPPNALGYCGPGDPGALLEAAADGRDLRLLGALAQAFDGAWPYLELIAAANGLADPLDPRVVEAYWLGNALAAAVPASALIASLGERFDRRAGAAFGSIATAVLLGGIPQHSFHVFAVYPWLGLLRAGMHGAPLTVLDRCRIRSGVIEALDGDTVLVRSRPLAFDGSRLVLAAPVLERARCGLAGVGLAGEGLGERLEVGAVVSLHWDWVCERLDAPARRALHHCEAANLRAVNALAAPGPAVAADAAR